MLRGLVDIAASEIGNEEEKADSRSSPARHNVIRVRRLKAFGEQAVLDSERY